MRRRPTTLLISTAIAIIALVGGFSAPAGTRAAVDLRICGTVTAYVSATAILPGALVVGPTALVIAVGTDLSSEVAVGANLCFSLDLDASGRITDSTVTANVTSTLDLCGLISSFAEADADSTGSLTIGGRSFVLAADASLPASVDVSANLCLTLTLNGIGQVSDGTAQANMTTTIEVCGEVTAVAAATATTDGSLTGGGITRPIAAGVSLSPQVRAGAFVQLRLTIDVFGRIADDVVLDVGASLSEVCGAATTQALSPTPGTVGSADPSPSVSPSDTDDPGALRSLSGALAAGGGGSSPSPGPSGSAGSPGAGSSAGPCVDDGPSSSAVGTAGILPDTASLARAGRVLGMTALPLVLMLLALLATALWRRRIAGGPEVKS